MGRIASHRIIHFVFDRMGSGFVGHDIFHLQLDVGFDHVLAEHVAFQQEGVVGLQRVQRLAQRPAHGGYLRQAFLRQLVQVFVHRLAGVDLVLDTVEPGHQHGGECQIRVRARIGEAHFHALALGAVHVGDAARGRTVARGLGQ